MSTHLTMCKRRLGDPICFSDVNYFFLLHHWYPSFLQFYLYTAKNSWATKFLSVFVSIHNFLSRYLFYWFHHEMCLDRLVKINLTEKANENGNDSKENAIFLIVESINNRSASSIIKNSRSSKSTPDEFVKWSRIRPGVPTTKSGRVLSSAAWR